LKEGGGTGGTGHQEEKFVRPSKKRRGGRGKKLALRIRRLCLRKGRSSIHSPKGEEGGGEGGTWEMGKGKVFALLPWAKKGGRRKGCGTGARRRNFQFEFLCIEKKKGKEKGGGGEDENAVISLSKKKRRNKRGKVRAATRTAFLPKKKKKKKGGKKPGMSLPTALSICADGQKKGRGKKKRKGKRIRTVAHLVSKTWA